MKTKSFFVFRQNKNSQSFFFLHSQPAGQPAASRPAKQPTRQPATSQQASQPSAMGQASTLTPGLNQSINRSINLSIFALSEERGGETGTNHNSKVRDRVVYIPFLIRALAGQRGFLVSSLRFFCLPM